MKRILITLAFLFALAPVSLPEVVTLKTGEKIRGRIVSRDEVRVIVKSPDKKWEIEMGRVASIEEREPLLREFHSLVRSISDTDPDGYYRVSLWCGEKGLFEIKDDVLAWVIGLEPDHEKARGGLGYFRTASGKWVKGKAGETGKDVADLFSKAVDHYSKREDKKAIEILKKILEESPQHLDARFLLGDIYYATGKMGHANREFEAALKIDSSYPWGHYGKALVSLAGKKHSDATAFAKKAIALSMGVTPMSYRKSMQGEFNYILGLSYRYRGASRIGEAEKAFKESTKLDRRHFRAWTELGILAGNKGKYRDAFNAYSKAMAAENTYIPARLNWGIALYRTGKLQEAVMKLMPLTRNPTIHPEAFKIIGRVYHRFNDFKRAYQYYTQYLNHGGKDRRVSQWVREVRE